MVYGLIELMIIVVIWLVLRVCIGVVVGIVRLGVMGGFKYFRIGI